MRPRAGVQMLVRTATRHWIRRRVRIKCTLTVQRAGLSVPAVPSAPDALRLTLA